LRRSARTYLTGFTAALAAATMLGTLPASAKPHAGHHRAAQHALRGPVTGQHFYFVMGDRFENGDTSNDTGGLGPEGTGYDQRNTTGFDPTSKAFYNGGDLKGLQSKLDYIKGLGTDAIWLTPIFKNKPVQLEDGPSAGYHGYWITDFTQVDPHLGTNADLSSLIAAAHRRGLKVYFDIITNHTADVIGYQQGDRTAYVSKDQQPYRTADGQAFDDRDYAGTNSFPKLDPQRSFPYTPVLAPGEEHVKKPEWLNDVTLYHNRGNTTFTGEDSQYGDFFGLDDLFTENPRVVKGFTDIYETWVKNFGIDGFRIDTMKHVNDEFWQQFGPGLVRYAHAHGKPDFFMFGEVALDGSDAAQKAFTSHYTTHDKMQAVLDFPFQDAARNFASRGLGNASLARFFVNDDWYTDADSNAYQLPTFLGNHDMGRIGHFLEADNPGAGDTELLARDRLAHELMYFSRGNPVVYYGDEQGFTGGGGDQLARQDMFKSRVPEYQQDHDLGTTATPGDDNFDTGHPLYREIRKLAVVTRANPALRSGAEQVRYASDGPGIFAFSRTDRRHQREYVVALNNSTSTQTANVPTYLRRGSFTRVYGHAARHPRSDAHRKLTVTVPALSAVVYRADERIPRSHAAPRIELRRPAPAAVSHGRMHVAAKVAGAGRSFYEVTFQAKVGHGRWRSIGTDDSAPYQVFQDTSGYRTGTPLRYRAVVLDNAGHTRWSDARSTTVPAPAVTVSAPGDGSTVTRIDPVTVQATVDPERADDTVRFERSVSGGAWEQIGVDSSSPAYTATDDVSDLALGTEVRYRAILSEPGSPSVTSDPVTVTTAAPKPARNHVTLVGDLQSELGCTDADGKPADWLPACPDTRLTFDQTDGQWHGTFTLPEGSYQWKIAVNDSWDENYGAGGAAGGSNLSLTVPAGGGTYEFTWNQVTHVPSEREVG
jgi:glycosidase